MVRVNKLHLTLMFAALALAGCARQPKEVAVAPPPPVVMVPAPMPKPPQGAALGLATPAALADGSYATPNRELSSAATVWHVRSALNVAALQCNVADTTIVSQYNAVLKAHAKAFAASHRTLEGQYRSTGRDWQDRFDDSMTRLYNFFAQPPVQKEFCAVAVPMIAQAAMLPAGGFEGFAASALPQLDAPFIAFYRAYDSYRVELASWKAGQSPVAPRLGVDPAVLMGSAEVTNNGRVQLAAR